MKSKITFGILLFVAACTSRIDRIEGNFVQSDEYSDDRSYRFKSDGVFEYENKTGWRQGLVTGRYAILDSIILLYPDTENRLDREFNPKLKIINSQCVRDFDGTFYCTNKEIGKKLSDLEIKFEEEIVDILDTLKEVIEERARLDSLNLEFLKNREKQVLVSALTVDHNGIIVVDRQELHVFQYIRSDSNPRKYFLTLLVRKKPFEIYRLNSADEMTLIYKSPE